MFVVSAKMDKKKLAAILVCLAVAAVVIVLVVSGGCGPSGREDAPLPAETSAGAPDRAGLLRVLKRARVDSSEKAAALLSELGWTVDPVPAEVAEVVIPEQFSDVYARYNEIQKAQDMDLSDCRGKTVTRYTFRVTGHPSGEEEVCATLLVLGRKVVGGDVCAARLDGFMHGLLPSDYTAARDTAVTDDADSAAADVPPEEEAAATADPDAAREADSMLPSN